MAINDPSVLEPLFKRLAASIEQMAQTMRGKVEKSMGQMQRFAERLGQLHEQNHKTIEQIADLERSLTNDTYREQLRIAEKLSQEWENVNQKKRNAAGEVALTDPSHRKALGEGAVEGQRGQNLSRNKQITGLEQGMKAGTLQPLIRESVELEKRARAVEKAMQWEKLKAEKGTIGALWETHKGKLAAVGTAATAVFAGMSAGMRAVSTTLGALRNGFQSLQGVFAQTSSLSNPAGWIKYQYSLRDLSAVIGQLVEPAFEKVTALVRRLADFLISLPAPVKNLVGTFAVLSVGVTAVGGALSLLAPLFTAASAGVAALVTVGGALVAAMGPVAAVLAVPLVPLAAIAATLTAGVGVWAAWKAGVLDAMSAFGPLKGLAATLTGIAESIEGTFEGVVPIIARVASIGIKAFEGLAAATMPFIEATVESVKALMPVADLMLKIGGNILSGLTDGLKRAVGVMAGFSAQLRAGLFPLIGRFLPIVSRVASSLTALASGVVKAFNPVADVLTRIGGQVFGKFVAVLARVGETVARVWEKMSSRLNRFVQAVMPSIQKIGSALTQAFEAVEPVIGYALDLFDALQPAIDRATEAAMSMGAAFAEHALPRIARGLAMIADLAKLLVPVFKSVASGIKLLADGIANTFKWLDGKIQSFMGSFSETYNKLRDLVAKGGVELPELPQFGGWGGGEGPSAPEVDFGETDENTSDIADGIQSLLKMWKDPPGSSVGAAMRPATFTSVEEFGRQATLNAYGKTSTKPEDKIAGAIDRQREQQHADAREILNAIRGGQGGASTSAVNNWF